MARLLQIAASTLLSGGILGGGNWMGYISNATRQAIGMGLAELSEGQVHYFSKHHDLLKRAAIQILSQYGYGLLRSYPRYLKYWEQRVRDKYLETQSQSSLANKTGQYYKFISEQQAVAQKKNYTDTIVGRTVQDYLELSTDNASAPRRQNQSEMRRKFYKSKAYFFTSFMQNQRKRRKFFLPLPKAKAGSGKGSQIRPRP